MFLNILLKLDWLIRWRCNAIHYKPIVSDNWNIFIKKFSGTFFYIFIIKIILINDYFTRKLREINFTEGVLKEKLNFALPEKVAVLSAFRIE